MAIAITRPYITNAPIGHFFFGWEGGFNRNSPHNKVTNTVMAPPTYIIHGSVTCPKTDDRMTAVVIYLAMSISHFPNSLRMSAMGMMCLAKIRLFMIINKLGKSGVREARYGCGE